MLWLLNSRAAHVVAELRAEQTRSSELRARVAAQQTTIDWLIAHVNELKIERAQLYQRIGIFLPVPTITRDPLPITPDNYVVPTDAKASDLGELLNVARDLRTQAATSTLARDAHSEAADPFDIFSDVGDSTAKAIGVAHDDAGHAVAVPAGR